MISDGMTDYGAAPVSSSFRLVSKPTQPIVGLHFYFSNRAVHSEDVVRGCGLLC